MAQVLRPLQGIFHAQDYPQLLVGLDAPDDAAIYQLDDTRAIISTMDFFPPVVDDPYDFGAIAAANALSDIYAMGGTPLMAINLVAYPDGLGLDLLSEILRGGAEKVREAGAVVAGGHTVTDKEPKYGLAVTGEVHPQRILRKGGAQVGDVLILSKALGAGVLTTALKRGVLAPEHLQSVVMGMKRLNKWASEVAIAHGVHAMTDITGYGLAGHAHEMAHLGGVDFRFSIQAMPWYAGTLVYAEQDIFAGGMYRNRDYYLSWVSFAEGISEAQQKLMFDPQTSGGLLMAVAPEQAQVVCQRLEAVGDFACIVGMVEAGQGQLHFE